MGVVTGQPGGFSRVSCFAGSGAFLALAGQTHHIAVADISGGHGGTLNVAVSASTPPRVRFAVNGFGRVDRRTGTATLSGTATCTAAEPAFVSVYVSQPARRGAIISAGGFAYVHCDGTSQRWSIPVDPESGKLRRGPASVIADASACDVICAFDHVERAVVLRERRR